MKKYLILFILLLSSFSVFAEGVQLICKEKPICINCPSFSTLFPVEEFSMNLDSLDIEADESEILSSQTYHFKGDVKVKSDVFILGADSVEVDSTNETSTATGNVRFQDNAFLISGDTLSANKDTDGNLTATVTNANYQDYLMGQGGSM